MSIKQAHWKTPFGFELSGHYRDGKNDWNTLQSIWKEDEYMFLKLCPNPKVAIDIGGHIGGWAVLAAKLGAQVDVVEILPENVELINQNADANGLGDLVKVHHKAIGEDSGRTIKAFYMDTSTESGDHHEFVGHTEDYQFSGEGNSIDVQTLSLDDLLADLVSVDVLKIDCEGGEWPAFAGASAETLDKINLIVGEIHPYQGKSYNEFVELLQGKFEDISAELGGKGQAIDLIAFRRK